ncbi:hypothetical protein B0H65DRAFT_478766 [Neurospora tetraspora]|uniref:Uncharacterized protein n=1 Tax=Neurospora tetraspora TaxID=94610 RepID=A0AAE0MMU2_9PEZI|nr:hypothetical protein B0H65DRAFT_478766 [Neurospora tetraspora]
MGPVEFPRSLVHYPSGRAAFHLIFRATLSIHLASGICHPIIPSRLDVMWVSCACPQKSIRKKIVGMRALFEWVWAWWRKETRERWAVGGGRWTRKRVVCGWTGSMENSLHFFFVDPPVCLGSAHVRSSAVGVGRRRSPSFPRCAHRPSRAERSKKKKVPLHHHSLPREPLFKPLLYSCCSSGRAARSCSVPRSRMDGWCGA